MSPGVQLILFFSYGFLGYARQFIWFLLKVSITVGICWGAVRSLDLFPLGIIGRWQAKLHSSTFDFPGGEYLLWVANNWLEISVLLILLFAARSVRVLKAVGQTSYHAAFASSALANYLDVDPTTKRLIAGDEPGAEDSLWQAFKPILKEGLYGRVWYVFTGIPFLPEHAIPGRNGKVVSFREDIKEYVLAAEKESERRE